MKIIIDPLFCFCTAGDTKTINAKAPNGPTTSANLATMATKAKMTVSKAGTGSNAKTKAAAASSKASPSVSRGASAAKKR